MASEIGVSLKKMGEIAEKIEERGEKMTTRFHSVYERAEKMKSYWKGAAYVNYVDVLNTFTDDFGRISKYFCDSFPDLVLKKRDNYAKADGSTTKLSSAIGQNKKAVSTKFTKIKPGDQNEEILFKEDKINELYDKIDTTFDNIGDDLDKLLELFNNLKWTGEAGKTAKSKFKAKITETKTAIKDIKSSLKTNISRAKEAMKKAESENTNT